MANMGAQSTDLSVEERVRRGVAFKIEGQYDEAKRELLAALEMDPNHARAHQELGLVYGFTGQFDESLDELRKAVELDSTCVESRNHLALTYSMLGMYEEARAEFLEVLKLDPDNEVAKRNLVYFQ